MTRNIKVIIVDDEKLAREIIKSYLSKFPDVVIMAECANGFDGAKRINEIKPDLIFLDIQMPKITGFEMLEIIDTLPVIIFTTAYDHYALKAFEVNAADYLLKPFSKERFDEAMKKAVARIENAAGQEEIVHNLIKNNDENPGRIERVIIKEGPVISVIPVESIRYIEAQDDYVKIYSSEGNYLKQKTMKYFEQHLNPAEFVRVHRSYIVSINEIKSIELFEKETYRVTLKDKTVLPVSKSGYDNIKEIIK